MALVVDWTKTYVQGDDMDMACIKAGNSLFETIQKVPVKHVFVCIESTDEVQTTLMDLLRNSRNPALNSVSIYTVFDKSVTKVCGTAVHGALNDIELFDAKNLYKYLSTQHEKVFFCRLNSFFSYD